MLTQSDRALNAMSSLDAAELDMTVALTGSRYLIGRALKSWHAMMFRRAAARQCD